jgi:CRISPR-associated endoribonuclease Cas6
MFLKDIEFVPSPEFEETMKMKMLSPLVLTKKIQNKKKYLSFQEKSEIIHRLQENLVQKFEQLHNKVPDIDSFKLKFDEEYCENREEKDLYSLIRMKEAGRNPFVVMGFLIPFTLEAPSELIQVGYYSGFGEKTSLGFGMAEVISTPTRIMEPRAKEEVKILSI